MYSTLLAVQEVEVVEAFDAGEVIIEHVANSGLDHPLIHIPPTAGFIAKYYLFAAVLETGHATVAVIAALNVVIGVYYYMRVVVAMFMSEPSEDTGLTLSPGLVTVLVVTIALTLLIGLYPEPFIEMARQATLTF